MKDTEGDYILSETHNTILQIFNKVKSELVDNPEYQDFKKTFDRLFRETFDRIEDNRLLDIKYDYVDQGFIVDYVVNSIPVKLTEDVHGIRFSIMMGVLKHLSAPMGIIINVVENNEPEFQHILNQ